MKHIIRYKLKPECVMENEALVKEVFAALQRAKPAGLRYECFKQSDGLSFVHIVMLQQGATQEALTSLPEFKAFSARIGERCQELPQRTQLDIVGAYGVVNP